MDNWGAVGISMGGMTGASITGTSIGGMTGASIAGISGMDCAPKMEVIIPIPWSATPLPNPPVAAERNPLVLNEAGKM